MAEEALIDKLKTEVDNFQIVVGLKDRIKIMIDLAYYQGAWDALTPK